MALKASKIAVFFLSFLLFSKSACGFERLSTYATIRYESESQLRTFNGNVLLGPLKYLMQGKKSETVADEVANKIDLILEKDQATLAMFPSPLKFTVVLHTDSKGVQNEYMRLYNRKVDYIAFYSPKTNTVFFSVEDANLRVVAHELGHVIVEHYFKISPPPKIHEVLAQFAESHITD
jgi:hypothetical protein